MIKELSIVIPALNEAVYLPRLLESIASQAYKGKLEVIVVDGHSEDDTVKLAKSFIGRVPGLKILSTERNIGIQRNRGADAAQYDYLLFLDADTVLPPHSLEMWAAKAPVGKPFVAATKHTAEDMDVGDRLFLAVGYTLCFTAWACRVPMVNGDFILTTRETYRKVSGFAEGALIGEDADFGLRAIKSGAKYKFYFRPAIIGSPRRAREMGRAKLMYLWARMFLHVRKYGPVYPGSEQAKNFSYPFGHYDRSEK